jgi:hypothetical protein
MLINFELNKEFKIFAFMPILNAYLTFNGNCEEVFNFYKSVFGGDFEGGAVALEKCRKATTIKFLNPKRTK